MVTLQTIAGDNGVRFAICIDPDVRQMDISRLWTITADHSEFLEQRDLIHGL